MLKSIYNANLLLDILRFVFNFDINFFINLLFGHFADILVNELRFFNEETLNYLRESFKSVSSLN